MKLSKKGLHTVLCKETFINGLANAEFDQSDFKDCVVLTLDEAFTAQVVLRTFCEGNKVHPFLVLANSIFERIEQAEKGDENRNDA